MILEFLFNFTNLWGLDNLSKEFENKINIENEITSILTKIGENPDRQGLQDTPLRVAKAYGELFEGYKPFEEIVSIKEFDLENSVEREVTVENIPFYSMCEHHLLPFWGTVNITYYPAGKVIGLSKIPRIINYFSRRLQLQERLAEQIAKKINELTGAKVKIEMRARHMCMEMRGVNTYGSETVVRCEIV